MAVTGIDQITYATDDLALSRRFFQDWGLKLVDESDRQLIFESLNACRVVVASLFSARVRRAVMAFAVAEGLWDWFGHREDGGLDPVRYVLYKRLDDIAYGAGLWKGALDARDPAALIPDIRN